MPPFLHHPHFISHAFKEPPNVRTMLYEGTKASDNACSFWRHGPPSPHRLDVQRRPV